MAEESLIVNGEAIAMMIRNPAHPSPCHIDASRDCPNCNYRIDNSNVSSKWPGLPTGVKFDSSDEELLDHLEGKIGRAVSHELIDYFIPTIEEAEGICYTHPENLPGMKIDGSTSHFFHKISNAYGVGTRKRRKISNSDPTVCDEHFRWHKTGKSTCIKDYGVKKGWKKLMVLYTGSKKGGATAKTGWKMHQYHIGEDPAEKLGELVVSKVFYDLQSKKSVNEESDSFAGEIDPTTPMTYPLQPGRPNSCPSGTEQNQEDAALFGLDEHPSRHGTGPDAAYPENQPLPPDTDALYPENQPLPPDTDALYGLPDLDYTWLEPPPDNSSVADIQFGSQDSLSSWLDCM